MRLTTRRKVALGFGTALLVIGAVGLMTFQSMALFVETTAAVGRAQQILTRLEETFGLITDAEAGSRGYVITGDERYLVPVHAARPAVDRRLAEIRRLTTDEPRSQARLRALEPLVERRFAVIEEGIGLRRSAGLDAARALVQTGRGKALTDSIRRLIDETADDQARILLGRAERERAAARRIRIALALGFLTAFGLTALAMLIVRRDLAERARAEAVALRAKEAAERASHAKSDFLARMSHELRTPLNSVIGFSNILLKNKRGNLTAQDLSYLDRIQANGTQLLALINDVLDLSKIEAGRMRLERTPVSLGALLPDILASFEGQLRDRHVELRAELPDGLAELHTDPARLQQVLVNLIGNALKFTERGSVTVEVEADAVSRAPVRIDVVDTGIGIPADRHEAIFGAFEQAEVGTTRRYGGTGLGLAISRSLCELMGYRLTVSSEPGRGSVFSVLLVPGAPRRRPDGAAVAGDARAGEGLPAGSGFGAEESADTVGAARRVVLVMDDDADSRTLLVHHVEEFGCEAVAVGSAEEGLRMAREHHPDLILLDLIMPGTSGWEALEQLKADPALRDTPVVIVSIVAGENRGRILGAVDLIDKPVTRADLFAALRRNLGGARGTVLVLAEDPESQRLLASYIEEAGELVVRCAATGREALAMLGDAVPDLIVLDQTMPTVDGLELLDALRGDERYLDVPVIIVTAKGVSASGVERRVRAEARADEARGEQVEREHLRRVLREIWQRQANGRRRGDAPAAR